MSTSTTNLIRKKTVQFGKSIQFEVESYKSLDSTLWWTKQEVREIEDESATIIHFMNNMITGSDGIASSTNCHPPEVDATIHAIRGLEKRTEIGAWEMYETQRDARNAVLNQQDKYQKKIQQLKRKTQNVTSSSELIHHEMTEAIANVYRIATLHARRAAYEVALLDRREAKREAKNTTSRRSTNNSNTTPIPSPLQRQSSKIILVTAEPIHPTWGRKISMPLMDEAKETQQQQRVGPTPCLPSSVTPLKQRVGPSPNLPSCITPMKKSRRLGSAAVESLSSPKVEMIPSTSAESGTPQRRKKISIFDLKHIDISDELDISKNIDNSDKEINGAKISPSKGKSKKKISMVLQLDQKEMIKMFNDSTNLITNPETTSSPTKTITLVKKKKKKSNPTTTSNDDNDTLTKKERKRNVPKRTCSHDGSKGDHTVDTEPMFSDHSSSSICFDDHLSLSSSTTFCHSDDDNNNNSNTMKSSIDFHHHACTSTQFLV